MELVGRHDEMALVGGFLESRSATPGPRALLLRGEPGAGKSVLLNHAHLMGTGTRLRINGQEALRNIAFSAVGQMLRDLYGSEEESIFSAQLISGLEGSSPLVPVQLYESVRRRLLGTETTLFIDDLQWLDDLSIGLVHFLVDAANSYGEELRVVAATRPGPPASTFLERMQRTCRSCEVVDLGGLDESSGLRLIRGLARDIEEGVARSIWERARGVPYWMIALTLSAETSLGGSMLEARMVGASGEAVSALTSMAALGRPLGIDELESILGWNHSRASGAVDELEARGLLRRDGSRIQIVHDLIREAVIQEASETRLARTHGEISNWLEAIGNPTLEQRLAIVEHKMAAGLPATSIALELARSDSRFMLGEGGLATLARVADLPASGPSHDLLVEVAQLASDMGFAELALHRWSIVFHRARDAVIRSLAALRAASAAMGVDRAASARQWLDLEAGSQPGESELAVERLALEAEHAMSHEHDTEQGLRLAARAVAMADTTMSTISSAARHDRFRPVMLRALQALHDAHMMGKDHASALSVAQRMVEVASTPLDRLTALTSVGITLRHLGRVEEAAAALGPVWTESNRTALLSVAAGSSPWYSGTLIELGRLDEARLVANEGRHLANRLGRTRSERLVSSRLRVLELLTGNWQAAIDGLRADILIEQDPHWRLALHELVGSYLSHLAPDDPTRATTQIEAAYQDALTADCIRCMSDVLVHGLSIVARVGQADAIEQWLERCELLDTDEDPFLSANLDHARALVTQEPARLTATAKRLEELGLRLSALLARLDLARSLGAKGPRPKAADAYRSLAADASSIGAATIREVAEKGLRQLGVRTWKRGDKAEASPLTERELEVASLVAAGASNPEIAEALFLSRKTVERHVSNILAKTGSRNRIELARAWGETNEGSPR